MSPKKGNRLFGTDGIRSHVGEYPMDKDSIIKLGNAVDQRLYGTKIAIGRDTRLSGEEITHLLASGMSKRKKIYNCGVIPTPGLSFITGHDDFDYGIMITASHNPWVDNGIKIFDCNGEKISDALEHRLEETFFCIDKARAFDNKPTPIDNVSRIGYIDFLLNTVGPLNGEKVRNFKIVLDCANGATFEDAPAVFEKVGFDIATINNTPDGKNINFNCGSTMLEHLLRTVMEQQADLGIAFDGDGDRVLMVDKGGSILNGDHTLYLFTKYFLERGDNFNKVVVGTVMGNLGLGKALQEMGVDYIRTRVGDRHVYQEMKRQQSVLGGEHSGHTILGAFQKTGDGILTALFFLKALFYMDLTPMEVFQQLQLYPQQLKSIKIKEKRELSQWDELNLMIDKFNTIYGENSRILIRYSDTEPKIRLMMESEKEAIINDNIKKFENFIKSTIGE